MPASSGRSLSTLSGPYLATSLATSPGVRVTARARTPANAGEDGRFCRLQPCLRPYCCAPPAADCWRKALPTTEHMERLANRQIAAAALFAATTTVPAHFVLAGPRQSATCELSKQPNLRIMAMLPRHDVPCGGAPCELFLKFARAHERVRAAGRHGVPCNGWCLTR